MRQRLRLRTGYLGRLALTIIDILAISFLALGEGHAEQLEQPLPFLIVCCGRSYVDLHAADAVDLVVVDLGEDQLLAHTEAVVAAAIERLRREAAEVTDTG